MKRPISLVRCVAISAACLPFTIGCGGAGDPPTAKKPATPPSTENAKVGSTTSGNNSLTLVSGVGTEPAQSVAIFLDSWRRGDETAANAVLTARAHAELAKTDYVIEPLGTPEGQFEIGRLSYPYPEKTVALVECLWKEPATEGAEPVEIDIVCEVHLEQGAWRISGFVATVNGTDETVVIDFEDASTIDAAHGYDPAQEGLTGPANSQVAGSPQLPSNSALPSDPTGLPNNLSLPNNSQLGNGSGYNPSPGSGDAPTQIALPPMNNAPLPR